MSSGFLIATIIILMMATLIVYFVYLYSSKERANKIEKRGLIPFMDEPLETKKDSQSTES